MILIKNVQIVDGSGSQPFRADIFINGDKISAIGIFPNKKADVVIDGLGLTATPGFVDVDTDSDHYLSLFTNPSQKDFLLQGVTTIIGGQCGSSIAPLIYGSLVSIRKWADPFQVNVGWNTLAELFGIFQKLKLGVNFGTLTGHATIRRDIVGEGVRDMTKSETDVFKKVLERSLKEGAVGLSTGLSYIHAKNVPYAEIRELVKLVAKYNRIYATHPRDEKAGLVKSVEETILVSQETGARAILSHFRPVRGFEKEFEESVSLVEKSSGTANVYFDVNPFDESLVPIYSLLPDWAKNGPLEVVLANLEGETTRKQIIKELSKLDLKDFIVAEARNQDYVLGKTIDQIANDREQKPLEALLDLMDSTGLRGMLAHKNLDMNLLENILVHPRSLIGSNGASLPEKGRGLKLERSTLTFKKFLEFSAKRGIPLEQAIKRITASAAQFYGIKNRGLLKDGYFADLVLFKDGAITDVLVNGKFAVRDSVLSSELAGHVIQVF
ncbi:MAG: amidohydrolase family protein [bacterium]|nr:amidohydrolase family protein [bacterium]